MTYINLTNKAGLEMIETVRTNFESYAKEEIEKAKAYRNIQLMIGHPSNKHYSFFVSQKYIKNCPIDVNDVKMLQLGLVRIN